MNTRDKRHAGIKQAMRDYGYRPVMDGDKITLIATGIRGFTSDEVLPYRFDSLQAAAEYLIPIIHDDGYFDRVRTDIK